MTTPEQSKPADEARDSVPRSGSVSSCNDLLDAIHCGDCMELLSQVPDKSVDAIITDPPYGVTACAWDIPQNLESWWAQIKRVRKPNAAIVILSAQPFTTDLITSNRAEFRYDWIWEKTNVSNGLNNLRQPARKHEIVCVFYDEQPTYNPQLSPRNPHYKNRIRTGIRRDKPSGEHYNLKPDAEARFYDPDWVYPQSVIFVPSVPNRHRTGGGHPTQKPQALMEYLVRTYTNEGDTVLDTFAGSGSTLVAAKWCRRGFIGFEKEKRYADISETRLAQEMCLGV